MKSKIISWLFCMTSVFYMSAQTMRPYGLMTDLIERTDIVYINGYVSDLTLMEIQDALEPLQYVRIASKQPSFSWIMDSGGEKDIMQKSYRIIVSDNLSEIAQGIGNKWDSGDVESHKSAAVRYEGQQLQPNTVYYWRVKLVNNRGIESDWSETKAFMTAAEMKDYDTPYEPQVKTDEYPVSMSTIGTNGNTFIDFGKASFGQVRLTLTSMRDGDTVLIHIGERVKDGCVDRNPAGTTRYRCIPLRMQKGRNTYRIKLRKDKRNSSGDAVLMSDYIGEVMPFRYVEIEGYSETLEKTDIVRMSVHYPFDYTAAYFNSSDTVLNKIWDLCKYSMKATSFIGYYIDGDRERIPYELDALLNQMSHYSTDRTYSLARRTGEYLLEHPTWPTEWILQTVLIAWNDYLYTGDSRFLAEEYSLLKAHTLMSLKESNGLISTRTKPQTAEFLQSINRVGPDGLLKGRDIRDIVDWPQSGSFGMDKNGPGEADYFVFTDFNTVVNAYHYEALSCMAHIAEALNKPDDALMWKGETERLKKQFNSLLLDKKTGIYKDGVETDHSALHSNMFPLAFGMVPRKNIAKVAEFIRSRGMACSIGNAQFLLDGMYNIYDSDYAFKLLTSTSDRSWYNTIRAGSTITFEAWDDKYKPNQDWNHPWGAVPANIIPRKLLGIEPITPAWEKIRIRPQTSNLAFVSGRFPTIKGDVTVEINNDGKSYVMMIDLPANTTSTVYVPIPSSSKGILSIDGSLTKAKKDDSGKFFVMENVGSGKRIFTVK